MSNLKYDIPGSPSIIHNIGSVSKQLVDLCLELGPDHCVLDHSAVF